MLQEKVATEPLAYDHDKAEAQSYSLSWKLMEKWKPEDGNDKEVSEHLR